MLTIFRNDTCPHEANLAGKKLDLIFPISADPSALPEGEAQGKREALTALPACQLVPVRAQHLWPARACSHGSVHRPPPRACSHGSVHRPCPRTLVLRCMSTYAASSFSFVAYRPCPPTMMLLP